MSEIYEAPTRTLTCGSCGNEWEAPVKRGRGPKLGPCCVNDETDNSPQKREAAERKGKLIVDNLEMMLKARGTHISQRVDDGR